MCDYNCVHPWWGGHGSCLEAAEDKPAVCVCDAGYASRGASGNPNCSPKRVIVATYVVLSVISAVSTTIIFWHMAQYRHVPTRRRSARKTGTRMKALCSTSVYTLGSTVVGVDLAVHAGDKGYFDPGVIQAYYLVMLPSVMFGVAMIGEYWVTNLPPQLIAHGSVADTLVASIEKYNAFFYVGCFNAAVIAAFGGMTFAHPVLATRLSDLVIFGGVATTITVITFVAVQVTGYIDEAMLKASPSSRAFYTKARAHVWQQAAALIGMGVVNIVDVTIKNLTELGRSTTIILYTVQIVTGLIASGAFALATSFPDSTATKSPGSGTNLQSPARSGVHRGCSKNAGTASTAQGREDKTKQQSPVHVNPNHGDIGDSPAGRAPYQHGAAKISSVLPL